MKIILPIICSKAIFCSARSSANPDLVFVEVIIR